MSTRGGHKITTTGDLFASTSTGGIKTGPKSKGTPEIPDPSDEQADIIRAIKNGKNVIVKAGPGSGKTTTVLQIAKQFRSLRISQMTFNKMLKNEVKDKARKCAFPSLKPCDVNTYHSFGRNFYKEESAKTDEGILSIIANKKKPAVELNIDLLVIDEVQDMRQTLCLFVCKVIDDITKAKGSPPQLLLLGDENQGVYEFLGSSAAYLTHAHLIHTKHQFVTLPLNTSFRLTREMAAFVNNYMLGQERIISYRSGPKVTIIPASSFGKPHYSMVANMFQAMNDHEIRPGEIAFLFPTLRNNDLMAMNRDKRIFTPQDLENCLVDKHKMAVHYPTSDESMGDERATYNKITISTFQQSKGRGWKYVCVYGVDDSYSAMFEKNLHNGDRTILPNSLYVACTRASVQLTIVTTGPNPKWEKIKRSELFDSTYSELSSYSKPIPDDDDTLDLHQEERKISVTRLCMYISESLSKKLDKMLAPMYKKANCEMAEIKVPSVIKIKKKFHIKDEYGVAVEMTKTYYEEVADKTGNAILHIYDLTTKKKGESTWLLDKCADLAQHPDNYHRGLLVKHLGEDMILKKPSHVVAASAIVDHHDAQTMSSPTLIDNFKWIDRDMSQMAVRRLKTIWTTPVEREFSLSMKIEIEDRDPVKLLGRIDAFSKTDVWEIKFVDVISLENRLQLMLYWWMWQSQYEDDKIFHLYNLKKGVDYIFTPDRDVVEKIIVLLIEHLQDSKQTENPLDTVKEIHRLLE